MHAVSVTITSAISNLRPLLISTWKSWQRSSEAIWSGPNNTIKFADVPHLGVTVSRGMTHDSLGRYLKEMITKAPGPTADIVGILKDTHTDVVINYLPVGSEMATKWYVQQILDAGCGMVNCIPCLSRARGTGRNASASAGCRSWG